MPTLNTSDPVPNGSCYVVSFQEIQNFLLDANFPMPLWSLGSGSGAGAGASTTSPKFTLVSESERTDRSEDDRETLGDQIKEKVQNFAISLYLSHQLQAVDVELQSLGLGPGQRKTRPDTRPKSSLSPLGMGSNAGGQGQ